MPASPCPCKNSMDTRLPSFCAFVRVVIIVGVLFIKSEFQNLVNPSAMASEMSLLHSWTLLPNHIKVDATRKKGGSLLLLVCLQEGEHFTAKRFAVIADGSSSWVCFQIPSFLPPKLASSLPVTVCPSSGYFKSIHERGYVSSLLALDKFGYCLPLCLCFPRLQYTGWRDCA